MRPRVRSARAGYGSEAHTAKRGDEAPDLVLAVTKHFWERGGNE